MGKESRLRILRKAKRTEQAEREKRLAESDFTPGNIPIYEDRFDMNYAITYEPLIKDEDITDYELEKVKEKQYYLLKEDPHKAVKELRKSIKKYPNEKVLYNYLTSAYKLSGEKKEAAIMVEKTYKKFPDYFFARFDYALLQLSKGDYQKVPIVFDNKFNLKDLYPERDTFHVTEANAFFAVFCRYYMVTHEPEKALQCYQILCMLDPDNDAGAFLTQYFKLYAQLEDEVDLMLKML